MVRETRGRGIFAGSNGQNSQGYGGVYIYPGATAVATADNSIQNNQADNDPDVFGTLETI